MREAEHTGRGGRPQDPLLHNMGAPRSRRRTERVRSSLADRAPVARRRMTLELAIPAGTSDLEAWLDGLLHAYGFQDWEEAEAALDLPGYRMLVGPASGDPGEPVDNHPLRTALILAKTGLGRYFPDGPRLFTRRRLERRIRLTGIDTNTFYGMD